MEKNLLLVQPNRPPFLFIDEVLEVTPYQKALTKLSLSEDEWFFKCHWEGDPNMPAMLQLEAMSQTASLCLFSCDPPPKKLYLVSVISASFRKKVVPGMLIEVSAEHEEKIRNIYQFSCKIRNFQDKKLISKALLQLLWPLE